MVMYRLLEEERLRRLRQQLGMAEPTERNPFAEYVPPEGGDGITGLRRRLAARQGKEPPTLAEVFQGPIEAGRFLRGLVPPPLGTAQGQSAEELQRQSGVNTPLGLPNLSDILMGTSIGPAVAPVGRTLEGGYAAARTAQAARTAPAAVKGYVQAAARGLAAQAVVPVKQAVTEGRKLPKNPLVEAQEMAEQWANKRQQAEASLERAVATGENNKERLARLQKEVNKARSEETRSRSEILYQQDIKSGLPLQQAVDAQQARRQALAAGQAEMPVAQSVATLPSTAVPARGRATNAVAPKAATVPEVTEPVIQPAAGQGLPPPGAAAPTRAGPLVDRQAAPGAVRQPNLQAGPRAEPIGPPLKPPPPKPFAVAPEELPSGRKPGDISRQKPTVTPEPLLKAEAALTPQGKTLAERISEAADSIVRGLFAQNAGLRDLPESSLGHPFSLAKVLPAASMKGSAIVTERYTPVLESVADNLKDLATYKMLQRDKDLLSGPKPIRNLPGGLTGMGDILSAEKQLAQKLGPERLAQVKQASEQLDVLNQARIQRHVERGTLTQEAANALLAEHPHYLPFQREDFVMGIESRLGIPTASVSSTGLKRMTEQGSVRALHDPLAGLLVGPIRDEHVFARNDTARALVESLQELEKKTGEKLVSLVGPERLAKEANIGGAFKPDLASIENSNVVGTISYLKDGVQYQAQIPAYYARIAKNLDAEVATGFINVMRAVTTPFKASVTAYNPGFPLVNLLRDATNFLFNGGLIPFGPSYMRGFRAVITKNANYIAARDAGTFMSGMIESMDSMSKINRVVGRHNRGAFTIRTPQDLALILPRLTRGVGRGIKAFNIIIEQTPRAGQFIAAKRAAMTSLESAVKGRDVTVDFAQFGTVMRTVDAIFPFANPAMQGLYVTARTIKTHPVRSALIGASFMFPTVLSRVNNMRFETSDKIPDYLYQNNWVVQFGEFTDEEGERMPMYFKIPKGPIAGPATFPAEALFNVARSSEDRSAVELLGQGALGSLKALSPIEPSTGAVAPPFGTAVQMQAGKDFYTGMPIVPRGQEGLLPEQQFGERTSKVAIALGQATKVSPRILDFALQDYFGGAGQALTWLSDLILGAVGYSPEPYGEALKVKQAPQKQLARLPVVGRVYGTTGSQLRRRGWEKFDAAVEDTNRQFIAIPGMNSLGVKLGAVGDSIDTTPGRAGGSVELTPDQRAEYQQHMARQVIPLMQSNTPQLSGIADAEQRRKLAMKAMGAAKDAARASFMPILLRLQAQQKSTASTQPTVPSDNAVDSDRLRQLREQLGMATPVGAR